MVKPQDSDRDQDGIAGVFRRAASEIAWRAARFSTGVLALAALCPFFLLDDPKTALAAVIGSAGTNVVAAYLIAFNSRKRHSDHTRADLIEDLNREIEESKAVRQTFFRLVAAYPSDELVRLAAQLVDVPDQQALERAIDEGLERISRDAFDGKAAPVGRAQDVERIREMILCGAPKVQLLLLYGLPGIGKSTLAQMVAGQVEGYFQSVLTFSLRRPLGRRLPERAFDLAEFHDWLLGAPPDAELAEQGAEKLAERTVEMVAEKKALIIVDQCEYLVDNKSRTVRRTEPHFSEFVNALERTDMGGSRVIFTGWQLFASKDGRTVPHYHVRGLDAAAAVELLHRYGTLGSERQLRRAAAKVGRHPQALVWLADLLQDPSTYTVEQAVDEFVAGSDRRQTLGAMFHQMFARTLSRHERSLMADLAVFEEPVPLDAVFFMGDKGQERGNVHMSLQQLASKALLEATKDNKVILDDLVREYMLSRCADLQGYHARAAAWYKTVSLPVRSWRSRGDAGPTLRAIHHLAAAGIQPEAMALLREGIGQRLTYLGMHAERIRLSDDLLKATDTWTPSPFDRAWLLRLSGYSYAAQGDYERGEQMLKEARQILEREPRLSEYEMGPDSLSVCLNGLARIALWYRHDHSKAIGLHSDAINICDQYGLSRSKTVTCADLAEAYVDCFYASRDRSCLDEAIRWGDLALADDEWRRDNEVRVWACRAEALALRDERSKEDSLRSATAVLEMGEAGGNHYARIRALVAAAVSVSRADSDLAVACLARAWQMCKGIMYEYGQQHITEVESLAGLGRQAASRRLGRAKRSTPEQLDKLIRLGLAEQLQRFGDTLHTVQLRDLELLR